jgi:hypothetical protein
VLLLLSWKRVSITCYSYHSRRIQHASHKKSTSHPSCLCCIAITGASVQSAVRSKTTLDRRHKPERHATEDRMRSGVVSVWMCDHEGRQVRRERYCHTYRSDRNHVSVLGGVEKSAQPFFSLNLVEVATTTTITITAGYFGWRCWLGW